MDQVHELVLQLQKDFGLPALALVLEVSHSNVPLHLRLDVPDFRHRNTKGLGDGLAAFARVLIVPLRDNALSG